MRKKLIFICLTALLFLNATDSKCQVKFNFPFQDPNLSTEERVSDLVSRMTIQEKVSQLFNQSDKIDRLGVPAYNWWNECLHGVAAAGQATVFPQAIGMAASFDENMMFRIANAISDEARAKNNFFRKNNITSIYTGLNFWSPNINIFRDPRWGRGQETYGEDPFLTSRMGVNFVKGLQGDNPKYFKVIATAKHYAVHSGPEFTRNSDNVYTNDYDLYNTYLPAFKALVKEANVQSIMCAYNRFRDKPCCGSDLLLSNILRKEFGFTGYVVSDCGAISDFYLPKHHNVVKTSNQALGWSLATGTDLNCEETKGFLVNNLDSAIKAGIVNEKDINRSLKRIFTARFKLGMFDPNGADEYSKIPITVLGSAENQKVALEGAKKAYVLLKNNGMLPLSKDKKVALIGPNIDNIDIIIANYNGTPINPVTPLKGLQQFLGSKNVLSAPGCPITKGFYGNMSAVGAGNFFHIENNKLKNGLQAEYFTTVDFTGKPAITRIDPNIDFYWKKSPINNLLEENFSIRWKGIIQPENTGKYIFESGFSLKIKINGVEPENSGVELEKGKKYEFVAEFISQPYFWGNTLEPTAQLFWVNTSFDYQKQALEIAQKADVIVFCGGISAKLEREAIPSVVTDGFFHGDRTDIKLPKVQEDLLAELSKLGKPIVFVNYSGSAVAFNWESENLPAVIQGFYPGEATGTALASILYGETNPSGRLPLTFYKSISDLPDYKNYNMEGRTYRYFKGKPLYEFGYGLSYTNFVYKNLQISTEAIGDHQVIATVDITNTGKLAGEEVVQVYLADKESKNSSEIRSLVAFKRITLAAGETKSISFTISKDQLSKFDADFKQVLVPGQYLLSVGGKQPDDISIANKTVLLSEFSIKGKQ